MFRYIAAGVLLVLLFCIVLAPASLLRYATANVPGLNLIATSGTVWSGSGGVVVQGEKVGEASWSFQLPSILAMELRWRVEFSGRDAALAGEIGVNPGTFRANASGSLGEEALNYTLQPWGILITEAVSVETISVVWEDRELTTVDGKLYWPGGAVSWIMDGQLTNAALPAMNGQVGQSSGRLTGLLTPEQGQIPVVQIVLAPDGTFTVKISKLLTRLLGRPWPGSEPDHAIVIEMVDKVF
jgi:hypothetical protein